MIGSTRFPIHHVVRQGRVVSELLTVTGDVERMGKEREEVRWWRRGWGVEVESKKRRRRGGETEQEVEQKGEVRTGWLVRAGILLLRASAPSQQQAARRREQNAAFENHSTSCAWCFHGSLR